MRIITLLKKMIKRASQESRAGLARAFRFWDTIAVGLIVLAWGVLMIWEIMEGFI